MERAKVIVHMRVSIDGKINGPFEQQEAAKPSSRYYSNELFKLSPANANGITTVKTYAAKGHPDLSQFDGSQLNYEDWVPKDFYTETYDISFDRYGRADWERNYFDYGGKKSRAVEVLTKQAPKAYLAFLRSMEIPYLICGNQDLDLDAALLKLKRYFGLDAIALCGGATIDGAFLRAGLVDEISLVVVPFVSGDNTIQSSFNTLGKFADEQFEFKSATKLAYGGVHLIFTKHN